MASITKHFSLIFLLIVLSSLQIHARDGQFFNKVPSNNGEKETQTVVPNKEQEPNFMPENENGAYGLYGHDSVSTPVTNINNPNVNNLPNSKYLPKNYNPVSYVTVPEDNTNENNFNEEFTTKHTTTANSNNQFYSTGPTNYPSNNNNNNNNQQQYYHGVSDFSTKNNNNNQQQQQFYSSNNQQYYNNNNNNNDDDEEEYYNAANSYYNNNNNNDEQQGLTETRLSAKSYNTNPTNYGSNYNNNNNNNNQEQSYSTNYNNYNTGKANYRVHQQKGMSDTRFLGNGKFYYDINAEKHAREPYENAREFAAMNQQYNNRNSYGNNEFNNNNSVENIEEFQDEENMH
ncbi:hypothetical protein K7X08_018074 [Anisodus acutangulus]|uniref:Uncharacterized protein n=1 Tax=Anisodus acutangulus TaxID=402998 RepID=A0A9Q1RA47_9SOLA|nr:hypothetical protein K7X08_018074 [Anisodus acutangulus]